MVQGIDGENMFLDDDYIDFELKIFSYYI